MLTWFGWLMVLYYIFNALGTVFLIGRSVRITPGGAVFQLTIFGLITWGLVTIGTVR